MTIAEVGKKFGLTPDTLRYYERIGLIPPVPRTQGGIRDYDEKRLPLGGIHQVYARRRGQRGDPRRICDAVWARKRHDRREKGTADGAAQTDRGAH